MVRQSLPSLQIIQLSLGCGRCLSDMCRQLAMSRLPIVYAERVDVMQASFKAAEEEQRQVIAKHGHELSMEALNDMKVGAGVQK